MAKKNLNNKENAQQLKINFDVVENITLKFNSEAKIISITSKKALSSINIQLKENSPIILNGNGQYQLDISINNPGGGIYLATVSYINNNGKQTIKGINLIIDNAYKKSVTLTLNTNDTIIIEVIN